MLFNRLVKHAQGIGAACALVVGGIMPAAHAAQTKAVDLSNPATAQGTVSVLGQADAIFRADTTQPAGTGVFNPFLRVQLTGSGSPKEGDEQGYNTSYKANSIFDDKTPVNWTHDIKFADLQVVTENGKSYYQLKLDINEPAASPYSLLSLDGLRLFSTNQTSQNSTNTFGNGSTNQPGDWDFNGGTSAGANTLLWDLDKGASGANDANNRYVLLDGNRNGGGSGIADMVVLFDKNLIDTARLNGNNGTNLILWSRFGINTTATSSADATADGGFEEWSFLAKTSNGNCSANCPGGGGGAGVPAPNSLLLLMLGLGLLGVRSNRINARALLQT